MASALRLKDQGEFAAAFEKVEILRDVSPDDPSVRRLYNDLVANMKAEGIPFEAIDVPEGEDARADEAMVVASQGSASIAAAEDLAEEGDYVTAITVLNKVQAQSTDPEVQAEAADLVAEYILAQEAGYVETAINDSKADLAQARELAAEGRYDSAYALLEAAIARVPVNTGTEKFIRRLQQTRDEMYLEQAEELAEAGDGAGAMMAFERYENSPSNDGSLDAQADEVRKMLENPYAYDIRDISPAFVEEFERVEALLVKGRAQFVNGDISGARNTFALVETISPENVEAKAFLYEIAKRANEEGYLDRTKTRAEMLNQVSRAWQQPRIYQEEVEVEDAGGIGNEVISKLESIVIPRITFNGTSLTKAIQSLSEQSEEFDRISGTDASLGVNMVVTGSGGADRTVNFSVRNLPLIRILDLVAQQTGYQWDVVDGVVEFVPSEQKGQNNRLERAIIPISVGTLDLILDIQSATGSSGGGGGIADDPFATPGGSSGPASGERQDALVNFFEASGINFTDIPGASIVNRGSRLLVNQTARNIDEIRQTLRELDVTDQVEIEAKFLEVEQGNLEELAFSWNVANQGDPLVQRSQSTTVVTGTGSRRAFGSATGFQGGEFPDDNIGNESGNPNTFNATSPPSTFTTNALGATSGIDQVANASNSRFDRGSESLTTTSSTTTPQFDQFGNPARGPGDRQYNSDLPTLEDVFGTNTDFALGSITSPNLADPIPIVTTPGDPPTALDLGADIVSNFLLGGVIGGFDVNLLFRAASRMEGSDLLSAPRVTVMSGKSANITVAQQFIYPTSYGTPTLTASTGSGSGGEAGSSSVALASGVPEDFETKNLGVELTVTPTVEPNDKINLSLQPSVTEFEGYVSYGGPNVAISGETVVNSPSGYFQPIFSVRTVETEVTVFDGATVVLGGLTREEVKEYKEKIPVLGDIPLIGRLFRSEGETAQKRNLLIFVTANLISPGGSPAKQSLNGTQSNSLFQNPTLISPGGILSRDKTAAGSAAAE